MRAMNMTEPASAAVAGYAAAKSGLLGKLLGLLAIGSLGAFLVALADPLPDNTPRKQRVRLLFAQFLSAGVIALLFTQPAVHYLDHAFDWINVFDAESWFEVAMPTGFILGALGWGLVGMLVKLREIIRLRGADAIAAKVGIAPEVKP